MHVSVGIGPVRVHGFAALLLWLIGRLLLIVGLLLYLAVCRPRRAVALLACCVALYAVLAHPIASLAASVVTLEVGHVWSFVSPATWRRHGRARLLAAWRSVVVYRRLWRAAMHAAELDRVDAAGERHLPRLVRVRCTDATDVVQVRGLLGQRFDDWETAGPMLAHVFGATGFVVHRGDDRRLTLELVRGRRGRRWHREPLELGQQNDPAPWAPVPGRSAPPPTTGVSRSGNARPPVDGVRALPSP